MLFRPRSRERLPRRTSKLGDSISEKLTSALMRKPVLPLDQEEKDWVAEGIKKSGLGIVDMTQFQ